MKTIQFNVLQFYHDHRIRYVTEGHKHCQDGWVQIPCPFCVGNPGYHLGYNLRENFFNCWRCGGKSILYTVKGLLGVSWSEAGSLVYRYGSKSYREREGQSRTRIREQTVKLPPGSGPLSARHKKYLDRRGYDPDTIEQIWKILGTGPLGKYKHRIIAPIYFESKIVSYQGRDITGRADLPYKACPQDQEVIDHKDVLYGADLVPGSRVVVVEGIFDAWRLGPGAVATFGVKFKKSQIRLLKNFSRIFVMYDSKAEDPAAWIQAKKLANSLSAFNVDVELLDLDSGDPGGLRQDEADEIMRELLMDDSR